MYSIHTHIHTMPRAAPHVRNKNSSSSGLWGDFSGALNYHCGGAHIECRCRGRSQVLLPRVSIERSCVIRESRRGAYIIHAREFLTHGRFASACIIYARNMYTEVVRLLACLRRDRAAT